MTSICQELSESDVKTVLVNNSTTPVFLSLILYEGIVTGLPTFSRLSCFIKLFDKKASTGT